MLKKIITIFAMVLFLASICEAKTIQQEAEKRASETRRSFALKYLMGKYEEIANCKARIKQLEREINKFKEEEFIPESKDVLIIEEFEKEK